MTETKTRIVYPKGLKASGKRLWRSVAEGFDLETHEELVLLQACRVADRLDDLADADVPLTTSNARGDQVTHPVIVEARQQSLALARLLTSLRIPDAEDNRPQVRAIRGTYGVRQTA